MISGVTIECDQMIIPSGIHCVTCNAVLQLDKIKSQLHKKHT